MTDSSPPAFPVSVQPDFQYAEPGMSLRDWFAGQALSGIMANPKAFKITNDMIYESAYQHADGMLTRRSEQWNKGSGSVDQIDPD